MKYFFLFSILVYQVYGDCGENNERNKYLGYEIVGSDFRASEEDRWRPCDLDDFDCMRLFLSSNSECFPVQGFLPDPIYLNIEKFFFPVSSMTVTHLNARIIGFAHSRLTEFYVNRGTGNLVMAVTIPTFNFSAHDYFTYHRTGLECITLDDYSTFEVDNVTLTAVIPKIPNLRLDLADIHAYTHNARPRAYIGRHAYESDDPDVQNLFTQFQNNIVIIIKEVFVFHAYLLFTTYIQDSFCHFGLDAVRNYDGYLLGKCYPQTTQK